MCSRDTLIRIAVSIAVLLVCLGAQELRALRKREGGTMSSKRRLTSSVSEMRSLLRAFAVNVASLFTVLYAIALLGAWRTEKLEHWTTLFLDHDVLFLIVSLSIAAATVTGLVAVAGARMRRDGRAGVSEGEKNPEKIDNVE